MIFQEALNNIVDQIKIITKQLIDKADFDRTYTGHIESHEVSGTTYIYKIRINGGLITVKSHNNWTTYDYVYVLIPRNQWNEATIIGSAMH